MQRRKSYPKNIYKTKRPSERFVRAGSTNTPPSTTAVGYVWEAQEAGTITNFKLDTGMDNSIGGSSAIAYALVYVPEGYNANTLTYPALTDDMYNPTKNVLISGVLNDVANEDHKSSRYSRKVVRGDRVCLLYYYSAPSGTPAVVSFELNFTQIC